MIMFWRATRHPGHLYEAAEIDVPTGWRGVPAYYVAMLRPLIALVVM
jgi:ABC-type sugar transport system permease subunit